MSSNPFESFFQDPIYLKFKNQLYNYRLRRKRIRKHLNRLDPNSKILEIGSGVSVMADGFPNTLFSDIEADAIHYLKKSKIADHAFITCITSIAIKTESVDAVVCSEVLEHIEDDHKAMQEIHRTIVPGGTLLITVPVHPRYYAFDDSFVDHKRRYAVWPLVRKLRKLGFDNIKLEKTTGFLDKGVMWLLTMAYSLFQLQEKSKGKRSHPIMRTLLHILLPVYNVLNRIFGWIVRLEAKVMPLTITAVAFIRAEKEVKPSLKKKPESVSASQVGT